jgi:hypothetical protein
LKNIFFSLLFLLSLSCKENKKAVAPASPESPVAIATDSLLITDSSWGFIKKDMNFSDLRVVYGATQLKDERICGPECIDSLDVTLLYPGTRNESIIYWQDSAWHKRIGMIVCYQDSAQFHTSRGLRINSGINELLRLNGKKISFMGFGWDYGGTITSFNKGALENSTVHYDIDLRSSGPDDLPVLGDISLDTEMPAVKKRLPEIYIRKLSLILNSYEY